MILSLAASMLAMASAAPMAEAAMSWGVKGRWGDWLGTWIEPVIAQDIMILDMGTLRRGRWHGGGWGGRGYV